MEDRLRSGWAKRLASAGLACLLAGPVRADPTASWDDLPADAVPPPPPPGQVWPVGPGGYGTLAIRVEQPLWAEIRVGDVVLGTTRQAGSIWLPAGVYRVELGSEWVEPFELLAQVRPGEAAEYAHIDLVPRAVSVVLGPSVADTCVVHLDGERVGTTAGLGRRVKVRRPERDHLLVLSCPEGRRDVVLRAPVPEGLELR